MLVITLEAARVNKKMTQLEVAKNLSESLNEKVTRQKVSYYENHPENTPVKVAEAFCDLYDIPINNIFFAGKSTLSYTGDNKAIS
ncbi:helix-turn-helix transcriptional regulator [Listeria sp. FSL L7-1582]|uniref:helix-turn-helix transcriptional regulator n=1 Tax=Listeria portnoyi TaxID=2713504 RepID=UPI00164DB0FA|nr:helix-turn-helix transcriptional regulator [Listeria portnoyi]MBC6310121.1 helix-turn-helix transcriptional regulator [Listeria portnoyi]